MVRNGPSQTDAGVIARRLGVSDELVHGLQARGVLHRLDLSDTEIRTRLHDAHLRATRDNHQLRLPREEVSTMKGRSSLIPLRIATAIATAAVAAGTASAYPIDTDGQRLVTATSTTQTVDTKSVNDDEAPHCAAEATADAVIAAE